MSVGIGTYWDRVYVANNMRACDLEEIETVAIRSGRKQGPFDVRQDFMDGTSGIGCYASFHVKRDDVTGIGGFSALPSNTYAAWFIGSELADEHWMTFSRDCKRMMKSRLLQGMRMINMIPAETAPVRQEWLKWVGFDYFWQTEHLRSCGLVCFSTFEPQYAARNKVTAPH